MPCLDTHKVAIDDRIMMIVVAIDLICVHSVNRVRPHKVPQQIRSTPRRPKELLENISANYDAVGRLIRSRALKIAIRDRNVLD